MMKIFIEIYPSVSLDWLQVWTITAGKIAHTAACPNVLHLRGKTNKFRIKTFGRFHIK